jgi:hypothetical protein
VPERRLSLTGSTSGGIDVETPNNGGPERRVQEPLARPIARLEPTPLRSAPGLRPAPRGGVGLSRRPVIRHAQLQIGRASND